MWVQINQDPNFASTLDNARQSSDRRDPKNFSINFDSYIQMLAIYIKQQAKSPFSDLNMDPQHQNQNKSFKLPLDQVLARRKTSNFQVNTSDLDRSSRKSFVLSFTRPRGDSFVRQSLTSYKSTLSDYKDNLMRQKRAYQDYVRVKDSPMKLDLEKVKPGFAHSLKHGISFITNQISEIPNKVEMSMGSKSRGESFGGKKTVSQEFIKEVELLEPLTQNNNRFTFNHQYKASQTLINLAHNQKGETLQEKQPTFSDLDHQETMRDYCEYIGELKLKDFKKIRPKRRHFIFIDPTSNYKITWDIFRLIFLFYQILMIPYRLSFNQYPTGFFLSLEHIIDLFFIIDIILSFNTAYFYRGQLVKRQPYIARQYFKTWFLIDFLASFPYTWFFHLTEKTLNMPKLLRLLRLCKFLRIFRVLPCFKRRSFSYQFESIITNRLLRAALDFFKLMLMMFCSTHWMACIFYYFSQNSTLKENFNTPEDEYYQYLNSLFWSFLTISTIKQGEIHILTLQERLLAIAGMILGFCVLSYIIGQLTFIFGNRDFTISDFKNKIFRISQFMVQNNLKSGFQDQVMRYLNCLLDNKKEFKMEEEEILDLLNDSLKFELRVHLNCKMLHQTVVFQHYDLNLISQLVCILQRRTFSIDELVFQEDSEGDCMYYLTDGVVILLQRETCTYIKEVNEDSFLSEVTFFSSEVRKVTARVKTFTNVMVLERDIFLDILGISSRNFEIFEQIGTEISEGNLGILGVQCYLCELMGHMAVDCKDFKQIKGNIAHLIDKSKHKFKDQINSSFSSQEIELVTQLQEVQSEKEEPEEGQIDRDNPFWSHNLRAPGGLLNFNKQRKPRLSHFKSNLKLQLKMQKHRQTLNVTEKIEEEESIEESESQPNLKNKDYLMSIINDEEILGMRVPNNLSTNNLGRTVIGQQEVGGGSLEQPIFRSRVNSEGADSLRIHLEGNKVE